MNSREAALRTWFATPGGRAFVAVCGGEHQALQRVAQLEQADELSATGYQDHRESVTGTRPSLTTARAAAVSLDPAAPSISGSSESVAAKLSRDPSWRVRAESGEEVTVGTGLLGYGRGR